MTPAIDLVPPLPAGRWSPTRAGLIAVWRFWDETFTFHDGRLLLRGPNGAGKSMALELLLPFLLDANTAPGRLTSATKSRGGLYERVMAGGDGQPRAGFAWVEFRRATDEVFTVGARLRASATTRTVDTDFFTTMQAIGVDLHLLDERRQPLSRKELVAAIGERGEVHRSGEEHRNAVRVRLYPGFSADRYASVVTALLALRKEKLSQNLDLAKLSEVLTDALPPIDEHDLAAVAEGFERLDRRRDELAALEAELAAVKALAGRQRAYARTVVAGVAGEVIQAESRRDAVTRAEREARAALDETVRTDAGAEAALVALDDRLGDIDAEVQARRASTAFRQGDDLKRVQDQDRRLRAQAEADESILTRRREDQEQRRQAREEAAGEREVAGANLTVATQEVQQVAADLGAGELAAEMATAHDPEQARSFALGWVEGRRRQTGEVRAALHHHTQTVTQRRFHEDRVDHDRTALDRALARRAEALEAAREAVVAYGEAVVAWAGSCRALGHHRVLDALAGGHDDPALVEAAVHRLTREIDAAHAVALEALGQQRRAADADRAALDAERADLAAGRLPEPDAPAWRGDRQGRAGAPLWRLVEPNQSTSPAEIDGIEAALGAAGFLDAWIAPDGRVDIGADTDFVLGARPAAGTTLAALMTPLAGAPVAADVVSAVLASVAVRPTAGTELDASGSDPDVVIATDGSFRLGAGRGQAPVVPARLLGAEAQERRRLERLAEVETAIAEIDAVLASLDRHHAGLDRERLAAGADLDAVPGAQAVWASTRAAEHAQVRVGEAEDRAEESREHLRVAEELVRDALRSLTTVAAEHGLPSEAGALDRIDHELHRLEGSVATWTNRAHQLVAGERWLHQAEEAHTRAGGLLEEAAAGAARSRREARDSAVALRTLEATVGVEFKEVLAQIGALEEEARGAKSEVKHRQEERRELSKRIGTLATTLSHAEDERAQVERERHAAHLRFAHMTDDHLADDARVAVQRPLEGVTSVLTAAREVASALEGVSSDARTRDVTSSQVDDRLHEARAALSGRADLSRDRGADGWWVLRASVNGLRRPVAELQGSLQHTLQEGRAELAAEEERLFEQTLAGSIRRSLATRIRQAKTLVDGINEQLGAVRTAAAGVGVKLLWEVDPDQPPPVKAARSLLLKDHLEDGERRALQDFVRARVDQARAELEHHAPWEARLRESLDYRAWHHFTLQIAHQDWDGFQPATAKRLQRLSTGERSIALHLPMLASIAAHYADEDGKPGVCPRLILLDELFAGVDTANRAKLFGTFTDWDLDAVFTSDHEWCQYATLAGIAIHQLHPPTGDEPLTSTRFTWDGHQRSADPPAA